MIDPSQQSEILERVADAAAAEGLLVAPIGSTYFLLHGLPRARTKDVDTVIHAADFDVVPLDTLRKIGQRLGRIEEPPDKASIIVRLDDLGASIDLFRGKAKAGQGFLPRKLLRFAATRATRDGTVLRYPMEVVLVLKADAWADRLHRAQIPNDSQDRNEDRATAFRADVTTQLQHALLHDGLDVGILDEAIGFLKKSRQAAIRDLFFEVSGGEIDVREPNNDT